MRAITLTRVVSFSSAMNSFSIGAITLRTACGTITWRIAWPWLIPSDRAASIWPRGHRFDPGPVDLGHVGAVDEHQGHDAVPEGVRFAEPLRDA